ncbi:hypothetical protein PYW08_002204 [Mythimna loreyi]|uniref:Uncharacterized protein n=1 Tax=Mythimna loreyi TaxID=667449 RepID=A0ACC2R6B0_9NEOP|nr:hypothetical protein PYW08_002204 [Mythimna loreyi]
MDANEPVPTKVGDDVQELQESDGEVDPIHDIIDYLVRCAKISFKNAHVDETEFGKYLAPNHISYFENLQSHEDDFQGCINQLKTYHSEKSKNKRIRNRRYNALRKLQNETDYFSEKQMMYRNPLLYEQLVGQYLSDEEIKERDGVDNENLTFLSMILETVDRNDMREMKNEQMLQEDLESMTLNKTEEVPKSSSSDNTNNFKNKKQWGDFDTPDTRPSYMPEPRKQNLITVPERNLLREEFLQEMFCSFIEGRDTDIEYHNIDNNEEYDDLQQVSQDAEDRYFDSESNEIENLEEHMKLVEEYGRKNSSSSLHDDPLNEFMRHIANKHNQSYIFVFLHLQHLHT